MLLVYDFFSQWVILLLSYETDLYPRAMEFTATEMEKLQSQAVFLRIGILFQVSQRRKRGNDVVYRCFVIAQHSRVKFYLTALRIFLSFYFCTIHSSLTANAFSVPYTCHFSLRVPSA